MLRGDPWRYLGIDAGRRRPVVPHTQVVGLSTLIIRAKVTRQASRIERPKPDQENRVHLSNGPVEG